MSTPYYLRPAFLSDMISRFSGQPVKVLNVAPFELDNSASILAVLTAGVSERPIGHFGLRLELEKEGQREWVDTVMKIKPHGNEIVEMLNGLAAASGAPLALVYEQFKTATGFKNVHQRELQVYEYLKPNCAQKVYGIHADEESGLYFILMESLLETGLLNSVMVPESWTDEHIRLTLESLAQWHGQGLNARKLVDQQYWDDRPGRGYMSQLTPLWAALLDQAHSRFPELYSTENKLRMEGFIEAIPDYWQELERMPKTMVHNDCNPRNMCFNNTDQGKQLCLYDWELSTFHVPAYDVVEFLCFVLDANRYGERKHYVDFYYECLLEQTDLYEDKQLFYKSFQLATRDFGLHRLGMYMMAHAVAPYPFLPRVVKSYFNSLDLKL